MFIDEEAFLTERSDDTHMVSHEVYFHEDETPKANKPRPSRSTVKFLLPCQTPAPDPVSSIFPTPRKASDINISKPDTSRSRILISARTVTDKACKNSSGLSVLLSGRSRSKKMDTEPGSRIVIKPIKPMRIDCSSSDVSIVEQLVDISSIQEENPGNSLTLGKTFAEWNPDPDPTPKSNMRLIRNQANRRTEESRLASEEAGGLNQSSHHIDTNVDIEDMLELNKDFVDYCLRKPKGGGAAGSTVAYGRLNLHSTSVSMANKGSAKPPTIQPTPPRDQVR